MPKAVTSKKVRRKDRSIRFSRRLLFASGLVIVSLYLAACLSSFRSQMELQEITTIPISMETASGISRSLRPRDADFYRTFAERLIFYPHDPEVVKDLYVRALLKSPASYQSFFSYANYLAARNCCQADVLYLLHETVRRCPTNPEMHRIAATYYLTLKDKEKALPFLRTAIELEPKAAQTLYRLLDQNQSGIEMLVSVTPKRSDAMIQLAHYLKGLRDEGRPALQDTLERLDGMEMDPAQRLQTARIALDAGLNDIARRQATLASRDSQMRAEAWRLLAEMLWGEGKREEFQKVANNVEQLYREQGTPDQAARYAIDVAMVLYQQHEEALARQRMLRVLENYPRYPAGYFQMAQLSRTESAQLELFYLQKASALAPENADYRKILAQRLLEAGRFKEAEAIYLELTRVPGAETDAYLGLARCKTESGNPMDAITVLQQSLERAVQSEEIYYQLGKLYGSIGEFQKSAEAFLQFARMSSRKVEGYNLAGDAYMNLGRYHNARQQFEQVLSLDSQNKHAQTALANLQMLGY